ncbi:hypothetical protein LMZ02_03445 [Paenibacillus macerans]|nr:sugar ABC transporter permease [Paenibacillus macerans]MCY7561805.1 hypothetical protein [Paenibacillus macerans]MDU5950175.1 sugar ABC transporter permease [Paenibacillus macerans]MEC0149732.1 sugar ABC transporter permease [Paenibacillus macerans]UMV48467.1 hypothetical protein LMZ02_03445 [Paenibacillus macerans]
MLTNGGPGYVSEMLSIFIYQAAFKAVDIGWGAASPLDGASQQQNLY